MFQVYETAFTDMKMGRASAFSVLAFAFIIVITVCMLLYMNKRRWNYNGIWKEKKNLARLKDI